MRKSTSGFTIVELLIVVVVIAILASISVVAYTGIQGRARDSKRQADLKMVVNTLELYRVDNGGYPRCGATGAYQAGGSLSGGFLSSCVADELVPNYIASIPVDPIDVAPNRYYYAVGYKKVTVNSFNSSQTDNYIIGASMDGGGSSVGGWGVTGLNYLLGSGN